MDFVINERDMSRAQLLFSGACLAYCFNTDIFAWPVAWWMIGSFCAGDFNRFVRIGFNGKLRNARPMLLLSSSLSMAVNVCIAANAIAWSTVLCRDQCELPIHVMLGIAVGATCCSIVNFRDYSARFSRSNFRLKFLMTFSFLAFAFSYILLMNILCSFPLSIP